MCNSIMQREHFVAASSNIDTPVKPDAKYVIKIEPHNNGPLFVEMNFYIRAARKHMSM